MARNDKTIIYVAAAGAVGFGIYTMLKNQYRHEVAAVIAPAVAEAKPSLIELLLGSASAVFAKARELDNMMAARGKAHYAAWKTAVKMKRPYYAVAGVCYDTKTGAGSEQCDPEALVRSAFLEGY